MPKYAPPVMFIEIAADTLKNEEPALIVSETKEFNMLGDAIKSAIVAQCGGDPMTAGYLLGVETARIEIAGMPAAVAAKVDL
jgi:hypothetical protein